VPFTTKTFTTTRVNDTLRFDSVVLDKSLVAGRGF
jgi:hypothetical protein